MENEIIFGLIIIFAVLTMPTAYGQTTQEEKLDTLLIVEESLIHIQASIENNGVSKSQLIQEHLEHLFDEGNDHIHEIMAEDDTIGTIELILHLAKNSKTDVSDEQMLGQLLEIKKLFYEVKQSINKKSNYDSVDEMKIIQTLLTISSNEYRTATQLEGDEYTVEFQDSYYTVLRAKTLARVLNISDTELKDELNNDFKKLLENLENKLPFEDLKPQYKTIADKFSIIIDKQSTSQTKEITHSYGV